METLYNLMTYMKNTPLFLSCFKAPIASKTPKTKDRSVKDTHCTQYNNSRIYINFVLYKYYCMAKKHHNTRVPKSELNKTVCMSIRKTTLDILETILPSYKRSELVNKLLDEYIAKHSQDPINNDHN